MFYRVVDFFLINLFVLKKMCVQPQLKLSSDTSRGLSYKCTSPLDTKFATPALLQQHLAVRFWAGAASWPQKLCWCGLTLGVIVSLGGVRLPLTESTRLTQIYSFSVGGRRMSTQLFGTKNEWLSCEAQARIFVCYCVLFDCVVHGWYWVGGWVGGGFQTLFEHNNPSMFTSCLSLFCLFFLNPTGIKLPSR